MTQLLNDPIDPFNRAPLTMADVTPQPELKAQIEVCGCVGVGVGVGVGVTLY